jgi:hypothetical protein
VSGGPPVLFGDSRELIVSMTTPLDDLDRPSPTITVGSQIE